MDNIYMTAINVLGENGGWPPVDVPRPQGPADHRRHLLAPRRQGDRRARKVKGFLTILKDLQAVYEKKPKGPSRTRPRRSPRRRSPSSPACRGGISLVELDKTLVEGVSEALRGGLRQGLRRLFGKAERKFRGRSSPGRRPLVFLQGQAKRGQGQGGRRRSSRRRSSKWRWAASTTTSAAASHATPSNRTWTIPHFEKMLYDNAQLLEVYAEAHADTKKPIYERVLRADGRLPGARDDLAPMARSTAALDADSEGEEGKFYIWTEKELAALITDKADLKLFRRVYGAEEGPNFEGRYSILRFGETPAKAGRRRETRRGRSSKNASRRCVRSSSTPAPSGRARSSTRKVLTAWNGQMIAGLARAGQVLDDKGTIARATKAADFILKTMRNKDGRLLRSYAAAPGEKPAARFNAYLRRLRLPRPRPVDAARHDGREALADRGGPPSPRR